MAMHTINKGLDLPISGAPDQRIAEGNACHHVALIAADYHSIKPKMLVQEGDPVKRGSKLFTDRKNPGVFFTSPGAGTVHAIHRGERRALLSVVIALSDAERTGNGKNVEHETFVAYGGTAAARLEREKIRDLLVESGLWTALRTRPFSRIPGVESQPAAIFVTAIDTNPLCADPAVVLRGQEEAFELGLVVLSKLTEGNTYLCKQAGSTVSGGRSAVVVEEFAGKHPAGNAGTHIHLLEGASREHVVWSIGYQDVIAVGKLFAEGQLYVDRVIAVGGPAATNPRLLHSRLGAKLDELLDTEREGEKREGDTRVVSGSVLSGNTAQGEQLGFLGRYHNQVSLLFEGRDREFVGWLLPGSNKFSAKRTFLSAFLPRRSFSMTTSTHGSPRAMVPLGMYERVMPLDIMPTFLLRALLMDDVERAEQLGILELDEEDLSLCTFVCTGKNDYGRILRRNLATIEKEG